MSDDSDTHWRDGGDESAGIEAQRSSDGAGDVWNAVGTTTVNGVAIVVERHRSTGTYRAISLSSLPLYDYDECYG